MMDQVISTSETELVPQGYKTADAPAYVAERLAAGACTKMIVFSVDATGHAQIKSFGDVTIGDIGALGQRLLQEANDAIEHLQRQASGESVPE